jgi:hypothetical protein
MLFQRGQNVVVGCIPALAGLEAGYFRSQLPAVDCAAHGVGRAGGGALRGRAGGSRRERAGALGRRRGWRDLCWKLGRCEVRWALGRERAGRAEWAPRERVGGKRERKLAAYCCAGASWENASGSELGQVRWGAGRAEAGDRRPSWWLSG